MAPLLPASAVTARAASDNLSQMGPLAARALLLAREDDNNGMPQLDPTSGMTRPQDINNTFIFILFGLIGVAFVITGIWFFFWAKNGGFYFKEDDWDDYKSTVLRRKGPNGTILSNATPSTNLGGGSIYKDVDDSRTEYTGGLTQMTGDTGSTLSGITAGPSDLGGRERRRQQREKKEREREKRRDRRGRGRKVDEHGVLVDEEAEEAAKRNLRAYRNERPARVGGLNKETEGSEWDGSTNPEMSTISEGSEPMFSGHHRQQSPTKDKRKSTRDSYHQHQYDTATEMTYDSQTTDQTQSTAANQSRKSGGIRKVYSTADRTTTRENERMRAEARRMAAADRGGRSTTGGNGPSSSASLRRDYSFQRAAGQRTSRSKSRHRQSASTGAIAEENETGSLMVGGEHDHEPDHGRHAGRLLEAAPPPAYDETPGPEPSARIPESDIGDGGTSDLGTKSYRHYIPGLSSSVAPTDSDGGGGEYSASEDRRERRRRREARRSRQQQQQQQE